MATAASHEMSVSPEAVAWVEGFIEGWRAPADAESFADHFDPMLDPEVRLVQPQVPPIVGRQGFREHFVRPLFELIPDVRGTVENWAASGDVIYIDIRLEGTIGGRPLTFQSLDRVTLRDARAIERIAHADTTPVLAAVARSPRVWPLAARQQFENLRRRVS